MKKAPPSPRDFDPPEEQPGGAQPMGIPPEFQPLIDQITASVSQQAAQTAVNAIVRRLPGIVNEVVAARMGQQANVQQPAGGMAGLMQNPMMAMLLQKFMSGDQPNPMDSFTKQIEMLSNVISAVDRIRGNTTHQPVSPPVRNANEALSWQKFGYEQGYQAGKSGSPYVPPEFPTTNTHVPPTNQV